MALSLEVQQLVAYIASTGVPHRVTATTGKYVSTSNPCSPHTPSSNHCQPGTGGTGLAIDIAEPHYSSNTPGLLAIFKAFAPVEKKLSELIYSGASYSIKNGLRVPRYAVSSHWDHIHVAVPRGTLLLPQTIIHDEGVVTLPDDPNLPNITGPVSFHPICNSAGECTGYYIFSNKTGELHSFGPGAKFYGRSEVTA